jgi:hypothetical protein
MTTPHSGVLVWCILASVVAVTSNRFALAQLDNSASTNVPLSATACTPECAMGFECVQGFCVAVEDKSEATSSESIAAPGLALGAASPAPTARTATTAMPVAKPREMTGQDASEHTPDDGDGRPLSEDVQDWSDYRHQGFYLRLGAGVGLGWVNASRREFGDFGVSNANALLSGEGEFSIGGSVGPVAFGYRGLVNPDITAFTGAFFDVYPDTLEGLHVEGSAGFAGPATDDFAGTLGLGYDFFFAREWSFGFTVRGLRSFGPVTISTVSLNASILCH